MYKRIHLYVSGPGCAGDSRNSGLYSVHGENPLHMPPSLTLCLSRYRLLLLMALGHHTHTLTTLVPLLYLLLNALVKTLCWYTPGDLWSLFLSFSWGMYLKLLLWGVEKGTAMITLEITSVSDRWDQHYWLQVWLQFWLQHLLHTKTITITNIQKVLILITTILKQDNKAINRQQGHKQTTRP